MRRGVGSERGVAAALVISLAAMAAFAMPVASSSPAPGAMPSAGVPRPSTVAAPSRFETFDVALPALGLERTVRVYLPRGYTNCEGCRYPVVYFMDGQNVFDAATSYAGEWGADETLDDLLAKHDLAVIAVGVDHGDAARVHELSVWENPEHAPARGEAFLADLVGAVKPAIDARYRTRPTAASTTIVGSSMGGLMAHAAVLRHPEVFGGALIFSPSYWFSPAIAEETARTPLRAGQRVFLYAGGAESESMVPEAKAMFERLRAAPPLMLDKDFVENPLAGHNETAWRAALPAGLCWRFAPICAPR
ncbi:MAG: alpha/beta hydrolase [Silanimonas sp.]